MRLAVDITRADAGHDKPPVILVHGAWHGAWCWTEHWSTYLADRGYTSYAVDLRGHGSSEGRLRTARIRDYVTDVRAVADTLGEDPILVGHSMGGFVVQHYLMRYRARAGVLVAPVPTHGATPTTLRVARNFPGAFLKSNLTFNLGPIVGDPQRARRLLFGSRGDAAAVDRYVARLQDESFPAYLDMMLMLPRPSRVVDPVFVIGGSKDAIFTPEEVEATAKAYGTEAIIFPDMAHDMMLDPAWERAAEAVVAFMDDLE